MRIRAACAAALLLLGGGCASDHEGYRPLRAGDAAPGFAAQRLDGDTVDLAALRGRAVMLNVWATWCPPCREEMPGLQALHETYGERGLLVLGVSVDSRGAEAAVREFVRDFELDFTILHDPAERVSRQFRTIGVPETFLIDTAGVIVRRWTGRFDPEAPDVAELVEAVLPRGDPAPENP
jgi:peroxiredoxin